MDYEDEDYRIKAASLKCISTEGAANIVIAVTNRENYGGKWLNILSKKYRTRILFSKLQFITNISRYNMELGKWEKYPVEQKPLDFLGLRDTVLGFSGDLSYLVTSQDDFPHENIFMNYYEISLEQVLHKNQILLRDCSRTDRFRIYFHPNNRFISTFVYKQEHLASSYRNGHSESSTFRIFTVFPDISMCLSMMSSATIVCRKNQNNKLMKKEYLRIHENGFILNTGVTLIFILFSKTFPIKRKKRKIWRVLKQDVPYPHFKPPSISIDLGEELSVESSLVHENRFEKMLYRLVDCDKHGFDDINWHCGLRHPFFISREEICIEGLIDRILVVYVRRTKKIQGARYRGCRDYETDVHHVDEFGICRMIIMCVCELQVPLKDGAVTQNKFFLCRVESCWNVFKGWIPGGSCRILKELTHSVAFNPGIWYPFARFPIDQEYSSYNINCEKLFSGSEVAENKLIESPSSATELVLDLTFF